MRKAGYLAVDLGPKLTLRGLEARVRGTWLDASSGEWRAALRERGIELLICGTSDSAPGREAEAQAQAAAHALGIPTVVVEDFPGNFTPLAASPPRLLYVDSQFAAELAQERMPGLPVHVGPAIRYDALRLRLSSLRFAHGAHADDAVLWIGQPEAQDALRTLDVLMPGFAARNIRVWLRAHPRDEGYARGAYAGLQVEDVSSLTLDECLSRRPRLVATQFSSVAIEAGFWGIPSLNVLFADAGGRTLATKKGYSVPPWCEVGAAFLILRPQEVDQILDRALGSAAARRGVMEAFDGYFRVREEGAPILINLLYNQGLL